MMLHSMEHLLDLTMMVESSVSDDVVEFIDHFVVSDVLLNPGCFERVDHIGSESFLDVVNPAKICPVHDFKVIVHSFLKIMAVHMLVQ